MKTLLLSLLALTLCFAACSNEHSSSRESTSVTSADATTDAAPPADAKSSTESSSEDAQSHRQEEPGQITAGEWRDADHWDFWQSLIKQDIYGEMPGRWGFNLDDRIAVKAVTQGGRPAADVPVRLLTEDNDVLWEGRSDGKGMVNMFPKMAGEQQQSRHGLKIEAGDGEAHKVQPSDDGITRITVGSGGTKALLEAAFVVDATGSMGDEMDYLKAELTDVIHTVADHNSGLAINTGAVFYRDEDDDYLTHKSDFTDDISETVSFIKKQQADGGGDFPEAVHSALDVALNELEWSDDARARLLFLVLDAPPHEDPAIIKKVNKLVAQASRKGIRIIPVVSSGIDKETEFLMRYMAIATGGTYVFLTDDSGIGNSHLQPTVGKYEVEYLNALLVRLIDEYVAGGSRQG